MFCRLATATLSRGLLLLPPLNRSGGRMGEAEETLLADLAGLL